ncbi:HvfC family RiPP maturation protein [Alishewanella tabrizica]|uniref:DUF2063 domain-containing protein n=1 Tax=Alishewanella tabrizica TaxID=671278 RepID=A0ABQ2WFJ2_9ALTE|nr:putative DNA-binding domain-containing protein [Alishewanella tabrizica]GGW53778.1 DUF2063 domain-containing protein [Alishewanella tabrizica]
MSSLKATQLSFANYLRDPNAHPVPEGIASERLQVYRDLFFNNVCGFIDNAFPVLHSLYDKNAWLALQQQFFAEYPCQSPFFLHIAEQFVSFLQQYSLKSVDPVFVAELAHYEWAELYIGSKPNTEPQTIIDPEQLLITPLALSDVAMLAAYPYPVHYISPSYQPEAPGELHRFLIYRDKQDDVIFVTLNHATLLLLHQISEMPGQTLTDVIMAIAPHLPMLTPDQLQLAALPYITQWAAQGALVAAR